MSIENRTSTAGVGAAIAVVIGACVAVGLGVFGKVHDPQFFRSTSPGSRVASP
jgi:hypothetical protein